MAVTVQTLRVSKRCVGGMDPKGFPKALAIALLAACLPACGSNDSSGDTVPTGSPDAAVVDSAVFDVVLPLDSGSDTGCVPRSCDSVGAVCGSIPNGCGGKVDCGECLQGETCGGGGPNLCGSGSCAPQTCAGLGAGCGWVSDGCAKALHCGNCAGLDSCGAAGIANQCGCKPKSCADLGALCGVVPDGCGSTVECGGCLEGQVCGGGGPNTCGQAACTPKSCEQLGARCGWVSDLCASAIDCGACTGNQSCGGAGIANQCGCTKKTCGQLGLTCGTGEDGCGGPLDCGICPVCTPGQVEDCYEGPAAEAGIGACKKGTRTCQPSGTWSLCEGAGSPSSDTQCDGVDNDCDGKLDDEYAEQSCGIGACAASSSCKDGKETACVAGQAAENDTSCDGIDNDCNGLVDDGYQSTPCGMGACVANSQCVSGIDSCSPRPSAAEVCDGVDNDCDGSIDNGSDLPAGPQAWCNFPGVMCMLAGRSFVSGPYAMKHDASGDAVGTSTITCVGNGSQLTCTGRYIEYYGSNVGGAPMDVTDFGSYSRVFATVVVDGKEGYLQLRHQTAYNSYVDYFWFSDFKSGNFATRRSSPPSGFVCQ